MLDRLVLKNYADYTSQRVKRTSGARVIFCFQTLAAREYEAPMASDRQSAVQSYRHVRQALLRLLKYGTVSITIDDNR